MPVLLERLGTEHHNLAQLLHILERQLDRLSARGQPDYPLLDLLLAYFLDFPERVHHPKEDMLLARLQARAPDAAATVGSPLAEHCDLSLRTRRLADTVRAVARGGDAGERDYLARLGRDFVDFYFHHMHEENENFFRLAATHLTDADWATAEAEGESGDDPLFGGTVEERFRVLEREIHRLAMEARVAG